MTFTVLVPREASVASRVIDRGSAVVAAESFDDERGDTVVYFEGNRYRSAALDVFDQRVAVAAGRMRERYPTVARALLPAHAFDVVGDYDDGTQGLTIYRQDVLDRWLEKEGGNATSR